MQQDKREKNVLTHGMTPLYILIHRNDSRLIYHLPQDKNHQHWSRSLERKVHRLFSRDVCGKDYTLKLYCFIFIQGVGGSRQLVGGGHPLVFSSEWCVIVRRA